ncbi:MAG: aminodeoxychorismate lyase, partial [Sphingobacteriales bacterium]
NYIYFAAREDFSGYHNFSADYTEHEKNAKKYREELDNRQIR